MRVALGILILLNDDTATVGIVQPAAREVIALGGSLLALWRLDACRICFCKFLSIQVEVVCGSGNDKDVLYYSLEFGGVNFEGIIAYVV